MAMPNAYQQYRHTQVNTATPEELTLMLYDGLIRFINVARKSVGEKNVEEAHRANLRAQDIISELMNTLNMNYEISHSLYALYDYMKRRLVEANIKKDVAVLDEVLGMARELRETWSQAMKITRKGTANG